MSSKGLGFKNNWHGLYFFYGDVDVNKRKTKNMSLRIPATSHLSTRPRVVGTQKHVDVRGRQRSTKSLVKAIAAVARQHTCTYHETTFSGVPENLFRNGSLYRGRIEAGSLTKIRSAVLKISLRSASGSSTLVSAPYFFDRIEFAGQSGSKHLSTIFPACLLNWLQNVGKQALCACNIDPDTWKPPMNDRLERGETRDYYLPLPNTIMSQGIYAASLTGDLLVSLTPAAKIQTGGEGTLACVGLSIICSSVALTDKDEIAHASLSKSTIVQDHYLEATRVFKPNLAMQASQETKIALDNLVGQYAYLLVALRKPGSVGANYAGLGPKATIDVKDTGGRSVLGCGTPVPTKLLQTWVAARHYPSSTLHQSCNLYLVPFCDSCRLADHGQRSGSMQFAGQRAFLAITPDAEGVSESHLITLEGDLDDDFYFVFRGERSVDLPPDATSDDIGAAIRRMRGWQQCCSTPIEFRVNKTSNRNGVVTIQITFESSEATHLNGDLLELVDGGQAVGTTTRAAVGRAGFESGAYDVEVIGLRQSALSALAGNLQTRSA